EDFILPGSKAIAYKQMGNSIAIPVVKRITEQIYNQILFPRSK
ncbi:DNA cytosine methyltransferase, partial [Candidatus Saccharibacteria bacterium]|nr:DNA cytosine methyltransferase [Candidatus Saccharibacteria bacterium]